MSDKENQGPIERAINGLYNGAGLLFKLAVLVVVFFIGFVIYTANKAMDVALSDSNKTKVIVKEVVNSPSGAVTTTTINKTVPASPPEEVKKVDDLSAKVSVELLEKKWKQGDYDMNSRLYAKYKITNNSEKTITAIKGSFEFFDAFGEPIRDVGLGIKEEVSIKPGQSKTLDGYWGNGYRSQWQEAGEGKKVTAKFTLDKVLFE